MKSKKNVIIASILGNALELYDFSLYGIFTPLFASLFFPNDNSSIALLASLITYAVGFFMRPLGGIVFGHLGDRIGRKNTLSLSIILMSIPTLIIGLLPTYNQIGLSAPIILLVCRLFQGLCAGGEYNGASIFIIEHLGESRSGLAGSLVSASGAVGSFIAMMLGMILLHESLPSWSWRIAFLTGACFAIIGFYMRRQLQESPEFAKILDKESSSIPIVVALQQYPISVLRAFGVGAFSNALANTLIVYLNIYLMHVVGISNVLSMSLTSIGLLFIILLTPLTGWISDKIGRNNIMGIGAILTFVSIYPLFLMLSSKETIYIVFIQIILAIIISLFLGPSNAFLNSLFPTHARYSGIALGYSLGTAFMGGTMPAISTYLIKLTSNIMAPAYYIMLCSILGLSAVCYSKKH